MVTPHRTRQFAAIRREYEQVVAALSTAISRIDDPINHSETSRPDIGHLPYLDIGHPPLLWAFVRVSVSDSRNSG
jgi:hypothetical protein